MKTRKPVRSDSFNSKLAAYSTTAVAALAMAPAADATIQNITTFSISSGPFGTTAPGVSGSAVQSFIGANAAHNAGLVGSFQVGRQSNGSGTHTAFADVRGGTGSIAAHASSASNLAHGATIIHKQFAAGVLQLGANKQTVGSSIHNVGGHFLPNGGSAAVSGYLGFKTHLHGKTYYGWLHVRVANDGAGLLNEISVTPETGNPGIFGAFGLAGDNPLVGELAPTPEPSALAIGGLGLLALGARGVREMRRRRKQEQAAA